MPKPNNKTLLVLLLMAVLAGWLAGSQPSFAKNQQDYGYERLIQRLLPASSPENNITISKEEKINDNFVRFGDTITIKGEVDGDVITIARKLTIDGEVNGDVIAAAENIIINGPIKGNVRIVADEAEINSAIGKNLNFFGRQLNLSNNSSVGWTLSFFASELNIQSKIGGNIYGYGGNVLINSKVGSNVTLLLGNSGKTTLGEKTIINGNLEYRSQKTATISPKAKIKGSITHKLIPNDVLNAKKFLSSYWIYSRLISLFGALLVGTLLISLFPNQSQLVAKIMGSQLPAKILPGILIYLLTPAAIILAALTIIGVPLAIISTGLYLLLLYLSKIYAGLTIGQKVIRKNKINLPVVWTLILGVVVIYILISLPHIGSAFSFIISIWFLGTIWKILKNQKAEGDKITIKKNNNAKNKPKSI